MSKPLNNDNSKIAQFEQESYVDPKGKTLTSSLGVPVLVGLSRKVLIENISKNKFVYDKDDSLIFSPQHRLGGSISLELNAYNNGAQIIRSHDTFETMQSIYCSEAVDINAS